MERGRDSHDNVDSYNVEDGIDEVGTPPIRRRSLRTLFYNFCQCIIANPLPVLFIIIMLALIFLDVQKYSIIHNMLANAINANDTIRLFHDTSTLINNALTDETIQARPIARE